MKKVKKQMAGLAALILFAGLMSAGCAKGGQLSSRSNELVSAPPKSAGANHRLAPAKATNVALGVVASAPVGPGRTDRLGVMSFNMEHRDKPAQLEVVARDLRTEYSEVPDFILLQEVMFNRSARKSEANTAAVLGNMLGYFCEGTKRTSDREGVAILSRYPFAFYDSRNLKSQTSALLLGFRRVSVMGEFLVPGTGRVRVVNVHFTNWGFEEHVRLDQLKETLQWIGERERAIHADVTFFGGDFNMEPDGREISLITNRQVTAPLDFYNFNSNEPTRGGIVGRPTKRIDYIFVSTARSDLKMIDEDVLWKDGLQYKAGGSRFWPSDHLAVLHEYALTPTLPGRLARETLSRAPMTTAAVGQ